MFKRWVSIKKTKSVLLIGPRRSGKTTLLKNEFPDFFYTTLDDLDNLEWAKRDAKGFVSSLGNKAVIDEIQRVPHLTIAVKYAIDNTNAIFMMSGSSSIGLLDSTADSLAGRINIQYLPTACWGEDSGDPTHRIFKDKLNPIQVREAQRLLPSAIKYGQFPEVLNQSIDKLKEELLRNYRDTYFTRDLMQLSNIENTDALLSILHNLVRSIGTPLEVSNFAREAAISFVTARKYLNTLQQSNLTFKLTGFQYGPAKRFIKAAKVYYSDCGIINSLNIPLGEGYLLESFVISELEKRRKLGFIKSDRLYYYKTTSGREIDLIFEADNYIHAVEIKASQKPGPGDLRNLKEFARDIKRPIKLYLFYPGVEYKTIDNVRLTPIAALYRGV